MIEVATKKAPEAIGTYSQAIKFNNLVFISGQIPLEPTTRQIVSSDFITQAKQVFENIQQITIQAGGSVNDIVKLTVYLTDLSNFQSLNNVMAEYFTKPYPARAAVEVSKLPKESLIEIDAIMGIKD